MISVGEVVVSGGHVVEDSSLVHLENSSIEVWFSSVQQSAVGNILFSDLSGIWGTVGLVKGGKSKSDCGVLEQRLDGSISELRILDWVVVGFG